jgi:hypothetical protein
MNSSEKYRLKALVCEKCSLDATDPLIKAAWAEIAIEWHALANRTAQERTPRNHY